MLYRAIPRRTLLSVVSVGFAGFLTLAFTSDAQAVPSGPAPAPRFAEGEVLVVPKAGLPAAALSRVLEKSHGRAVRVLAGLRVSVVAVAPGTELAVAQALKQDAHIKHAQPNWLHEPSVVPNDPLLGNEWHVAKVGAPGAWDLTNGSNVVIAILDTGVNAAHPDLAGKVLVGWNSPLGSTDTSDFYGHGTWVAGVAGASTNNAVGVAGIGWAAQILPVRITNRSDAWAYSSDIAAGINWAAQHGAKVINLSYDMAGDAIVESAAQQARAGGAVVVVAAGNTGTDRGYGPQVGVVFVAATDSADAQPSWSSFGAYVDVSAPGTNILTTDKAGAYATVEGTSFSAPITSGVLALMRAANPALAPGQLEQLLFSTAVDLGSAGYDTHYGYGRVNALAAVAAARNATATDTQPPVVAITFPFVSTTVSGLVAVKVTATDNVGVAKVSLYAGTRLIATDTALPFEFAWDTTATANGNSTLRADAVDGANNSASSQVGLFVANGGAGTDTVAPVTTISSPINGSTVSGTVTISATATDNVAVTQLAVSVDGQLLCAATATVSCSWNTRRASAGAHAIAAVGTDAAGNKGSTAVSVTVGAPAPPKRK